MSKVLDVCTVTRNRRISIPPHVAKKLDIAEHDRILLLESDGKVIIEKAEA